MTRRMGWMAAVVAAMVGGAVLAQAPKAPAKAAPAKVAAKKADGGVAAPDAGVAPKAAEKKAADGGVKADAGVTAAADAGVAPKAEEKKPAGGAKYTLVAVAAPDKKIERLFKSKCASCHGNDGKGATEKGKKMKLDDFTLAGWQTSHGNDELKKAIVEGYKGEKDGAKQEMDAFKDDLTPDQVDALLQYVRFLGAPK